MPLYRVGTLLVTEPLSSINQMNLRYFILILFYYSCSNDLERIPIVKCGIENEMIKSQYNSKIKLNGTTIYDQLSDRKLQIDYLYGLAKFEIEEMDTSYLRPFDLYLMESKTQNKLLYHFITLDKKSNKLIDKYDFDPDSLEVQLIYQHSSNLDHDGIAIELIEDSSLKDSLKIYVINLEVLETGRIKFISKSISHSEIFKVLTSVQKNTGYYSFIENDIKIDLYLKDGLKAQNYSYKLNIFTPEGCVHTYLGIDSEVKGNSIDIDSIGSFKLFINDKTVNIVNSNFESACEEILELNYELKKTDDNK